ncbi:Protein HID1 [Diplonema papillatum]|nr:Protein HID1 [Diplonema papillatum]
MGSSASKAEFSTRVTQLAVSEGEAHHNADFWRPMFLTEATLEEIHSLLKADEVRQMRHGYPQNLAMLFYQCIEQLRHFLKETQRRQVLDLKSASNSIRIITRLLPLAFEDSSPDASDQAREFATRFFWKNSRLFPADPAAKFDTIAGDPLDRPLGALLVDTLMEVAHTKHFCVYGGKLPPPDSLDDVQHKGVDPALLWYGGLGPYSAGKIYSSASLDRNRLDVVVCLLSCCSGPLFQKDALVKDPFLHHLVTAAPHMRTLAFSLLNSIIPYDPSGSLPYTSYVTDDKEPLMNNSLHLLLVLLDNGYLIRACDLPEGKLPPNGYAAAAEYSDNVCWQVLAKLGNRRDMTVLFNGITKLLSNPMLAKGTWLPRSQKQLDNTQEVCGLLWKLLDSNRGFIKFMCRDLPVSELVVPALHQMYQAKASKDNVATMQIGLWCFLLLSSERDFGIALNERAVKLPPVPLPVFNGTYIDLIVIVFQQLIQSGVDWIRVSTDGFLTVIANLSPYAKSVSMVTATKLLNLFEAISTRRFLLSAENNWMCLSLLLQVFTNLIQYQYEGSIPLVYAILRRQKEFYALRDSLEGNGPSPANEEWRSKISMATIVRMLDVLFPDVKRFCEEHAAGEPEMLQFLSKTTLVGLLPQPHPILIRSHLANSQMYRYISTWVWGLIYNKHRVPPLFTPHAVKLFPIYTEGPDGSLQQIHAQPAAADAAAAKPAASNGVARPLDATVGRSVASNTTNSNSLQVKTEAIKPGGKSAHHASDPELSRKLKELDDLKQNWSSLQRQIRDHQELIQRQMSKQKLNTSSTTTDAAAPVQESLLSGIVL